MPSPANRPPRNRRPDDAPLEASSSLQALQAEVLAEVDARRQVTPAAKRRVDGTWLVIAGASWLVVLAIWLIQPALIRGPQSPDPETTMTRSHREASLRYGLWLAHGAVERFRARDGRLPQRLSEAGIDDPALSITVKSAYDYELTAREGALRVLLTPDTDMDAYGRDALRQLRGGE